MKPLLVLTLLSLCAGDISSFAQDTTFFNSNWRDTTASAASYYRTRIRQGSVWQVTDHYLNGKPQMSGAFSDDSCHIRQGPFTWYDSSGLPFHESEYLDNKINGKDTRYYKGGKLELTGSYVNGKKHGAFTGYYPSGKISGKAQFLDDKQVSGNFYREDGSAETAITDFIRESEYQGGAEAWMTFLNKNLRYPQSAYRHKIEGIITVEFMVTEEGEVTDVEAIKTVYPALDAEAVRVISKSSGKWLPAVYGGRLVKSYKKQPVIFKLQ